MLPPQKTVPGAVSAAVLAFLPQALFQTERPPVLCVSGGRDSMLLLELFRELWSAGGLRETPLVFHFCHRLRPEPETEADVDLIRRRALKIDWPLYIMEGNVRRMAERTGRGLEEAGRLLRYRAARRLVEKAGAGQVVTGHHGDDFAESLLLFLCRGGGPQALTTMPLVTRLFGLELFRPLLVLGRAEIDRLVQASAIPFREDLTNADETFRRNRIRARVLPELRELGLEGGKLWRNFHDLPAVRSAPLEQASNAQADAPEDCIHLDRALLRFANRSEWKTLLDLCLRRLGLPPAGQALIDELKKQWVRTDPGMLRYQSKELIVWAAGSGPVWLFHRGRSAALRPFRILDLPGEPRVRYNNREQNVAVRVGETIDVFRPGDRVRLPAGGTKKVKKIYQELRLPPPVRQNLPLVRATGSSRVLRLCLGFWEGPDRAF